MTEPEPLTDEQTKELRDDLLTVRKELQELVAVSKEGAKPVDLDVPIGRLSRMDAMQAQAMAQASSQRREQMLRNITAALGRLERDEFGDCQSCEEPINPKRLEFDPTATLCIDCASESES